jgi:hypothetical protein
MNYQQFAAEYRRLFALMVQYGENGNPQGSRYAEKMAELSEKVPPEWVNRAEGMDATEMLFDPKPAEFWLKNPKEG